MLRTQGLFSYICVSIRAPVVTVSGVGAIEFVCLYFSFLISEMEIMQYFQMHRRLNQCLVSWKDINFGLNFACREFIH